MHALHDKGVLVDTHHKPPLLQDQDNDQDGIFWNSTSEPENQAEEETSQEQQSELPCASISGEQPVLKRSITGTVVGSLCVLVHLILEVLFSHLTVRGIKTINGGKNRSADCVAKTVVMAILAASNLGSLVIDIFCLSAPILAANNIIIISSILGGWTLLSLVSLHFAPNPEIRQLIVVSFCCGTIFQFPVYLLHLDPVSGCGRWFFCASYADPIDADGSVGPISTNEHMPFARPEESEV